MTEFDKEMQDALRADAEKLRAMGADVADPVFLEDVSTKCENLNTSDEQAALDSEEIVPVPGDGPPYRFHEEWAHHARSALSPKEESDGE